MRASGWQTDLEGCAVPLLLSRFRAGLSQAFGNSHTPQAPGTRNSRIPRQAWAVSLHLSVPLPQDRTVLK